MVLPSDVRVCPCVSVDMQRSMQRYTTATFRVRAQGESLFGILILMATPSAGTP